MEKLQYWYYAAVVVTLVCVCFYNSLNCGFVFDDMSAVVDNKDLKPHTPISNIFFNDFWGTPMYKERSHKSYRPLCVLTFRLNYALTELAPLSYHLVNVFLHLIVSLLLLHVFSLFVPNLCSFIATCLFAVHPIHTEAVTGVVGRAETLSAIFFLASLLAYTKCSGKQQNTDWRWLLGTIVLVTIAMLCKEQGITVIGVCCVYEIFIAQQMSFPQCLDIASNLVRCKKGLPSSLKQSLLRSGVLVLSTSLLLFARIKVMGAKLPVFTTFDNPASTTTTPTRQLTYNYLLSLNSWLLLFPSSLCCDWTMGTVPVLRSLADIRNLATLLFYAVLFILVKRVLAQSTPRSRAVILSLSLMVLPFLPASNLFFPVGFVVAERTLYTPSMGFCLLVSLGIHLLIGYIRKWKSVVYVFLGVLILSHSAKTIQRNFDWESEYSLFRSALRVNKNNAKLWNNVGHALEKVEDYEEALKYFNKAVSVQSDDLGAHINVGRTLNNLQRYTEAESAYQSAMSLLPPVIPGEKYTARIAPSHLNIFLNLANLISKNESRLLEADKLYRTAVSMRPDYTQAYINRGDILIKLGRREEAVQQYKLALTYEPDNSDAYFNLGVLLLQEHDKKEEALNYFNSALQHNPQHHVSAPVLQKRLEKLHSMTPNDSRVYFNQAMLAMDDQRYAQAEQLLLRSISIEANFSGALFNLALMLSNNLNRSLDAYTHLQQLLHYHANHTKGLTLLGDININVKKDLDAAEAVSGENTVTMREKAGYASSRIQRANRTNGIERIQLSEKLTCLNRQRMRQIRLTNQDIRLVSSSLDYIRASSGKSTHGVSVLEPKVKLSARPPCFMYGERLGTRLKRRKTALSKTIEMDAISTGDVDDVDTDLLDLKLSQSTLEDLDDMCNYSNDVIEAVASAQNDKNYDFHYHRIHSSKSSKTKTKTYGDSRMNSASSKMTSASSKMNSASSKMNSASTKLKSASTVSQVVNTPNHSSFSKHLNDMESSEVTKQLFLKKSQSYQEKPALYLSESQHYANKQAAVTSRLMRTQATLENLGNEDTTKAMGHVGDMSHVLTDTRVYILPVEVWSAHVSRMKGSTTT